MNACNHLKACSHCRGEQVNLEESVAYYRMEIDTLRAKIAELQKGNELLRMTVMDLAETNCNLRGEPII